MSQASNPQISVVIATYNSSQTLKYAIQSVLNQDFQNFEIWVVGDGCTDNSAEVVAGLQDTRVYWHNLPINSGNSAEANNYGCSQAKGQYIAILGHDDLWFPWHLSRNLDYLERTNADLVYCMVAYFDPGGFKYIYGPIPYTRTQSNIGTPCSSWLYKKGLDTWQANPYINLGIDSDFWYRAVKKGRKIELLKSLNVIKFSSHDWNLYGTQQNTQVQAKFLSDMKADPIQFYHSIMLEAAITQARSQNEVLSVGQTIRQAFRKIAFRIILDYGWDTFPLSIIFANYTRYIRKKIRIKRGLKHPELAAQQPKKT